MGNVFSSVVAFILNVTASVFALRAWRESEGEAKKWLGWGGLILLLPAIFLFISIILILLGGLGILFVILSLSLSLLTIIVGAGFVIYGTLLLVIKEEEAKRDAIISSVISGIGASVVIVGFILKVKGKK